MSSDSVEKIAQDIFSYLAARFPVCCWSDEFIFFPQVLPDKMNWSKWDDFSPESVGDAVQTLRSCRERLGRVKESDKNPGSREQLNASLLYRTVGTLEEQLEHVRHHAVQPTFVLMVATVGLVQALQGNDSDAFRVRMETLPGLLNRFRMNLGSIPDLFRQAGIRMASEFSNWLRFLGNLCDNKGALAATEDLVNTLKGSSVTRDFRLRRDILERVVHYHMGSNMDVRDCILELEDEIQKTADVLESEAGRMGHGKNWECAYSHIGEEKFTEGKKTYLLYNEIERLRQHCVREGFPGLEGSDLQSLTVEPLPESLTTVRSSDSYNAKPGHPYRGGVFYIFGGGGLGHASDSIHPAYRMTTAHETYPGHHLLDMCRWNNPDPLRRSVEYPLFYEGWACFGEELMLYSGAFNRGYDRLILAWRRHRHAVRGKVDLLMNLGELDLDAAAQELEKAGLSRERAGETVRKYALRPAYQMCYTVGHRRFQALFDTNGDRGTGSFARTVLGQGEILFEDLERILKEQCLESGV